jgi:hypothetical protein
VGHDWLSPSVGSFGRAGSHLYIARWLGDNVPCAYQAFDARTGLWASPFSLSGSLSHELLIERQRQEGFDFGYRFSAVVEATPGGELEAFLAANDGIPRISVTRSL